MRAGLLLLIALWIVPAAHGQVADAERVDGSEPSAARVIYVVQGREVADPASDAAGLNVALLRRVMEVPYLQGVEARNGPRERSVTIRFQFDGMDAFLSWYDAGATRELLDAIEDAFPVVAETLDAERVPVP